ncbi:MULTISPECIES: hypothetical protein [Bacillus]|nr:hypothetical protein EXW41_15435 [Bacillus wiedmannii]
MKVKGQWLYMCGVIDSNGNPIDLYLREKDRLCLERRL